MKNPKGTSIEKRPNISNRDFFNPLGSGDIKQAALLLSYVQRFFTAKEAAEVWNMITLNGAKLIGFKNYELKVGNKADVTVFGECTPQEVIAYQSQPTIIIRSGEKIL